MLLKRRLILRSMTRFPETGSKIGAIGLNSTTDSGASFSCRCTTSVTPMTAFRTRTQSTTSENRASAWQKNWRRNLQDVKVAAPISEACVRGLRAQDAATENSLYHRSTVWFTYDYGYSCWTIALKMTGNRSHRPASAGNKRVTGNYWRPQCDGKSFRFAMKLSTTAFFKFCVVISCRTSSPLWATLFITK